MKSKQQNELIKHTVEMQDPFHLMEIFRSIEAAKPFYERSGFIRAIEDFADGNSIDSFNLDFSNANSRRATKSIHAFTSNGSVSPPASIAAASAPATAPWIAVKKAQAKIKRRGRQTDTRDRFWDFWDRVRYLTNTPNLPQNRFYRRAEYRDRRRFEAWLTEKGFTDRSKRAFERLIKGGPEAFVCNMKPS
jgi:hypothetical protein